MDHIYMGDHKPALDSMFVLEHGTVTLLAEALCHMRTRGLSNKATNEGEMRHIIAQHGAIHTEIGCLQ